MRSVCVTMAAVQLATVTDAWITARKASSVQAQEMVVVQDVFFIIAVLVQARLMKDVCWPAEGLVKIDRWHG